MDGLLLPHNGDKFKKRRERILFYAGLIGLFTYVIIVEFLAKDFHVEFLLIFGTMMGLAIFQGIDK